MPSSYTSLNYHIVFSTKHRKPLLVDSIREGVYKYIAGIIQNKQGQLIEIGGIEDHVHILTSCSPKLALADFIRDVKANASKWINEQPRSTKFAWAIGIRRIHRQRVAGRRGSPIHPQPGRTP